MKGHKAKVKGNESHISYHFFLRRIKIWPLEIDAFMGMVRSNVNRPGFPVSFQPRYLRWYGWTLARQLRGHSLHVFLQK